MKIGLPTLVEFAWKIFVFLDENISPRKSSVSKHYINPFSVTGFITSNNFKNMQQSQRRTILVTGANKGIGYGTIEKFFSEATPYDLILTSTDPKLGETAIANLKSQHPKSTSTLTYHQLDVTDDKSVDNLVKWLKDSNRKIDVLVNNAAILDWKSDDELKKRTVKTNFSSVVKLTEKLIPYLTSDAKVLLISSMAGQLVFQGATLQKALSDPKLTEAQLHDSADRILEVIADFKPQGIIVESSYPASKALLNAYGKTFLPAKLKLTQQVYSVHPGMVQTDMGGPNAPLTLQEGVDPIAYLINLPFKFHPELNGKLIGDKREIMEF